MQRSMQGFFLFIALIQTAIASPEIVHLAVSTSIRSPVEHICQKFSQATSYKCQITSAPSGHLYAHIMHGVQYDLFISSDETYTQGLVNARKIDQDGRFVIATGRVVLWSATKDISAQMLYDNLINQSNMEVIIANPGVSSYGQAAKEVLQSYQLWSQMQGRLIYGKNIKHSFDLLYTKRVPMGFVSLAQLSPQTREHKRYWEPDPKSYKPVLHEIVALKPIQNEPASKALVEFMLTKQSCQVLQEAGYNCSLS